MDNPGGMKDDGDVLAWGATERLILRWNLTFCNPLLRRWIYGHLGTSQGLLSRWLSIASFKKDFFLKLGLHWGVALNSLYSAHQIFTEYLLDVFGSIGEVMARHNLFLSSWFGVRASPQMAAIKENKTCSLRQLENATEAPRWAWSCPTYISREYLLTPTMHLIVGKQKREDVVLVSKNQKSSRGMQTQL